MLNRFKHIVEEMRGLIDQTRSASCLIAVSGGVDSMCLADLWVRAFGTDSCAIAHCNFKLRGEDSDADEALVTEWANSHGIKLHKVSFDTVQYASDSGVSIEMAARELRYRWFGELCAEFGYAAVVVAHHADDNAETMVLNMIRGAGLKGLSGMKPVSPLPLSRHCEERSALRHCEERSDVAILRPLLTFTRKQIEGHAFAWKVPYREDKTNASTEYRRNSIRHEVFPLFERMNPSYARTLNREMTYLNDASSIVDEWCRAHVSMVVSHSHSDQSIPRHCEERQRRGNLFQDSHELSISTESLLSIPQWRYLLYYILEPYGFNSSVLESLEGLLTSDRTISGKRFDSEDYVLLTERDSLVITKPYERTEVFMPIHGAGIYHVNGSRVGVEVIPWTTDMPLRQPEGTIILDAAKLQFPFILRKWRSGDWLVPLGMRGKKKISDLFTDLKYDHMQKEHAVMIVDTAGDFAEQQHVAGIVGARIDNHYRVTSNTETIIRITIS